MRAVSAPTTSEQARSAGRTRTGAKRSERRAAYLFVLPLVAIFAGFYLWPAFNTAASSFFRWGLLQPWKVTTPGQWDFVGVHNYAATLSDPDFWTAAVNTLLWLVVFPLLVTGFSLLISILIWYTSLGRGFFRTVFVLPMTISLAATGVIWSFVYNPDPDVGVLNAFLKLTHLNFSVHWGPIRFQTGEWLSNLGVIHLGFADLRLTNLSLIVPAVWAFAGFGVITFTAGLTSVSHDLVEAARVDGARARDLVRYVLLPALRRPLVIVLVISVIFALRVFDIVFVMTQGGPAQDTQVLALLLWQQAFAFIDSPQGGLAAALAVLMSLTLIVGGYPYLRALTRRSPR
jgi:raffinose/stachyose/melibiose transport system permease protein